MDHTIDALRAKYPDSGHRPVILTEVTRMSGDHYCIAGWDVHAGCCIRPLLPGGEMWPLRLNGQMLMPGLILECVDGRQPLTARLPHRREDWVQTRTPTLLERWTLPEVHHAVVNTSEYSIRRVFGRDLDENRYVPEGTDCPSLGSIRLPARNVRFIDNGEGRLRLWLRDADQSYTAPVTSNTLTELFSPQVGKHGIVDANRWLNCASAGQDVVIRLGFSRGWDGGERGWSPRRCYLQANNVICAGDLPLTWDGDLIPNTQPLRAPDSGGFGVPGTRTWSTAGAPRVPAFRPAVC
ncbi:MAG: hypothetical protein ACLQVD_09815 [Capsulimonadaceae bacterium]